MSNGSIDFSSDWDHRNLERHLRDLAGGRLPGKWGLLQDLVSHWAIPSEQRGLLRYGKASLDSLGSVLSFRESQKEVVDGGRCPSRAWMREQGYEDAFTHTSRGFGGFVRSALTHIEFREKRIRSPMGGVDRSALREFTIDADRVAYFLDPSPDQPSSNKSSGWFGPYCKAEDRELLEGFISQEVWSRLATHTILLETVEDTLSAGDVRVSPVSDVFDFASACDAFNDVASLARRCHAFLGKGRSRTLLFQGPPGTGKSTLARALARELGLRLVLISQEAVTSLCDATTLRILALLRPGVVVLNDVDRSGGRAHQALLQGLEQAIDGSLLTVLTVNDITQLDPALLRPGRVHEVREVPEPSRESRKVILRYFVRKHALPFTDDDVAKFLERSDGFSPADIKEFSETAEAMGVALALEELTRIAEQRALYSGDRCQEFNQARVPRYSPGRRYRRAR